MSTRVAQTIGPSKPGQQQSTAPTRGLERGRVDCAGASRRALRVGAIDDPLERDADERAAAALSGSHPPPLPTSPTTGSLQRSAAGPNIAAAEPAGVLDAVNGPGVALDAGARARFEPRFGHDFSS